MAVGVPDRSRRDQRRGPEAGLLLEFPGGRLDRTFAPLDLATGEFPQAPEQTARRTSLHEPSSPELGDRDGGPDVGTSAHPAPRRDRPGIGELGDGPAAESDRAVGARRNDRSANGLSELHHGLVELPRRARREQLGEHVLQALPNRPRADVPHLPGPSRRDAQAVRLERHDRNSVRDAGDRPGDVRADPRKLFPFLYGLGKSTRSVPDDRAGGGSEVAGPGAVPRSLPDLQDLSFRSAGEVAHRRERAEESLEVRDRLGHAGLLEEDFGNPHPVRIAVGAPGPRPAVGAEPGQERGAHGERDRRRRGRSRPDPHRKRREEPRA